MDGGVSAGEAVLRAWGARAAAAAAGGGGAEGGGGGEGEDWSDDEDIGQYIRSPEEARAPQLRCSCMLRASMDPG